MQRLFQNSLKTRSNSQSVNRYRQLPQPDHMQNILVVKDSSWQQQPDNPPRGRRSVLARSGVMHHSNHHQYMNLQVMSSKRVAGIDLKARRVLLQAELEQEYEMTKRRILLRDDDDDVVEQQGARRRVSGRQDYKFNHANISNNKAILIVSNTNSGMSTPGFEQQQQAISSSLSSIRLQNLIQEQIRMLKNVKKTLVNLKEGKSKLMKELDNQIIALRMELPSSYLRQNNNIHQRNKTLEEYSNESGSSNKSNIIGENNINNNSVIETKSKKSNAEKTQDQVICSEVVYEIVEPLKNKQAIAAELQRVKRQVDERMSEVTLKQAKAELKLQQFIKRSNMVNSRQKFMTEVEQRYQVEVEKISRKQKQLEKELNVYRLNEITKSSQDQEQLKAFQGLERKLEQSQQEGRSLREKLCEKEAGLELMSQLKQRLELQVQDLKQRLIEKERLESNLAINSQQQNMQRLEIEHLEVVIQQLKEQVQEERKERNRNEKEFKELQDIFREKEKLEQESRDLRAELRRQEKIKREYELKNKELTEQKVELKARLRGVDSERLRLQALVESREQRLRHDEQIESGQVKRLRLELKNAQQQKRSIQIQKSKLEQELHDRTNRIEGLEKNLSDSKDSILHLRSMLMSQQQEQQQVMQLMLNRGGDLSAIRGGAAGDSATTSAGGIVPTSFLQRNNQVQVMSRKMVDLEMTIADYKKREQKSARLITEQRENMDDCYKQISMLQNQLKNAQKVKDKLDAKIEIFEVQQMHSSLSHKGSGETTVGNSNFKMKHQKDRPRLKTEQEEAFYEPEGRHQLRNTSASFKLYKRIEKKLQRKKVNRLESYKSTPCFQLLQ